MNSIDRITTLVCLDPVDTSDPRTWLVNGRPPTTVEMLAIGQATEEEWDAAAAISGVELEMIKDRQAVVRDRMAATLGIADNPEKLAELDRLLEERRKA